MDRPNKSVLLNGLRSSEELIQVLNTVGVEVLFPELSWSLDRLKASCYAVAFVSAKFIELGDIECAKRELIGSSDFTVDAVRRFLLDLIVDYEKTGLVGLKRFAEKREMFTWESDAIVKALVLYDHKLHRDVVLHRSDEFAAVLAKSRPVFALSAQLMAQNNNDLKIEGLTSSANRFEVIVGGIQSVFPVSVVIPTFNRSELLLQAVQSIGVQKPVPCEIIVVDDCGIKLSGELIEKLRDLKVTVLRHRSNLGLGAARNTGALFAKSPWLCFLDDDDVLVEGSLQALLEYAGRHSVPFIFGDHLRQLYKGSEPSFLEYRRVDDEALQGIALENPIMCGSFIVQREDFLRLGGYREDLPVHEDYNLHIRLLSSLKSAHLDKPVCVYHCREDIPRLNNKRLYWFATAAFNHVLYRSAFQKRDDYGLKIAQREQQYFHLERALREGSPPSLVEGLINAWWDALRSYDLFDEMKLDRTVISSVCPSILNFLS